MDFFLKYKNFSVTFSPQYVPPEFNLISMWFCVCFCSVAKSFKYLLQVFETRLGETLPNPTLMTLRSLARSLARSPFCIKQTQFLNRADVSLSSPNFCDIFRRFLSFLPVFRRSRQDGSFKRLQTCPQAQSFIDQISWRPWPWPWPSWRCRS